MKKVIYSLILLTTILVGCKKDKDQPDADSPIIPGGSAANTTPAYVPPQPGSLKVNVSSLTLHPGDNATVIATLYNDTCGINMSAGLIWNSSNSSIANVTSGFVTANSVGNCAVTVTDGIHGIIIINISVVSSTTSIVNTPSSITCSLFGGVLTMNTNSTSAVSNYTVYNSQGVAVFPAITFIPPTNSGLVFSGNSVTSSSITGSFNVKVKAGSDTLTNTLNVVVLNTDTVYSLDIVQGTLPRLFYKNNIAATNPLLINVKKCWIVGSTPTFSNYITSPDNIEIIGGEDGVKLNNQGKLESVKPTHFLGGALVKISYKGSSLYRGVGVCVNLSNTWGTTLSNGDTYNYCITQTGPDIYYNSNEYWVNNATQFLSGNYFVKENGTQIFYGSDDQFTGFYKPTTLGLLAYQCVNLVYTGQSTPEIYNINIDGNHISKTTAGSNPNLLRGSGSCPSISLFNVLMTAPGACCSRWYATPCYYPANAIHTSVDRIEFGGTGIGSWPGPWNSSGNQIGLESTTWQVLNENGTSGDIKVTYTSGPNIANSFTINVSNFSLNQFTTTTNCIFTRQ